MDLDKQYSFCFIPTQKSDCTPPLLSIGGQHLAALFPSVFFAFSLILCIDRYPSFCTARELFFCNGSLSELTTERFYSTFFYIFISLQIGFSFVTCRISLYTALQHNYTILESGGESGKPGRALKEKYQQWLFAHNNALYIQTHTPKGDQLFSIFLLSLLHSSLTRVPRDGKDTWKMGPRSFGRSVKWTVIFVQRIGSQQKMGGRI